MHKLKKLTLRLLTQITDSQYQKFYSKSSPTNTKKTRADKPVLLDTSLKTDNAGDEIIMHFAEKQLHSLWDTTKLKRISTHSFNRETKKTMESVKDQIKIVCGTNSVSTHPTSIQPIALPRDPSLYDNSLVLLASGLRYTKKYPTFSETSKRLLSGLLSDEYIHSVRDSHTEKQLREIGISNVLNTSCVTLWEMTPERCSLIPRHKGKRVLTTITDYAFDAENDRYMLQTLSKNYDQVFLWIQGAEDKKRLNEITDLPDITLVKGGFYGLQRFIENKPDGLDYFGTRLHCGIYCMNNGIRSTIVSVDNRAHDIQLDTNLPTIERASLKEEMEKTIQGDWDTHLTIPFENIEMWKAQFK